MVAVAQLVRASGRGPEGCQFDPDQSPLILKENYVLSVV